MDVLVLPLVAALTAAEAQDDNVAFRVGLNAGAQVADDLLALGGEAVAGSRLVEEGQGHVDKALLEEPRGAAVALGGDVVDLVPRGHVAHHVHLHGVVLNLAREEDLLGRGAVEDVGDALVVAHLTPELGEHLLGAGAVVALVQVEDDLQTLRELRLNPGEAGRQV